ncbi:MAG TPA: hypothetical protein VGO35_10855 [Gammaproteobacteria bacterium]|jgi:hypothetical protein|nr:hypothetical protein [Gammaproteobacteria bacterium]
MKWQQIRSWLAILALVALSVAGFWGVDQEWRSAISSAQKFSAFVQIAYSVLGLLAVPALLLRYRWSRVLLYLWAFAILLTGATAPVIWGGGGWWAGFFAACMMAVISGLVIWLTPLPAPGTGLGHWRWLMAGAFGVAALVVLSVVVRAVAPVVVGGEHMERFCEGMRSGITERELADLAGRQGYLADPGDDAKGHYLRIEDDASKGRYRCEARFKPDGAIATMNFTANKK